MIAWGNWSRIGSSCCCESVVLAVMTFEVNPCLPIAFNLYSGYSDNRTLAISFHLCIWFSPSFQVGWGMTALVGMTLGPVFPLSLEVASRTLSPAVMSSSLAIMWVTCIFILTFIFAFLCSCVILHQGIFRKRRWRPFPIPSRTPFEYQRS